MGNGKPRVLPIIEIDFNHLPSNLHRFDSYEAKWIYDNPDNPVDPIRCPPDIKPKLRSQLERISRQTFNTLGCVDLCRIDYRLDSSGVPNVIDVNALPGLIPDRRQNSRYIRSCYAEGLSYNEIILSIFKAALKRYNLAVRE